MKIVVIAGARPNFVKISPLLRAMRRRPDITPVLVHTGQHYDAQLSDQFFTDLGIEAPAYNLEVGSGSHAVQTAEVMKRLEPVLGTEHPDRLMVVGDVNSTIAAALVAVKLGIPVDHVEAGLRSFDRTMPEEINRILTDAIADQLFVSERSGVDNLLREGIPAERIHLVGNVMIDALEACRPRWEQAPVLRRLGLEPTQPYALVTLHRPSNVDNPETLRRIVDALETVSRELTLLWPVHPRTKQALQRNPRVQGRVTQEGNGAIPHGLLALDPLGYLDCLAVMSRARLVLTDSGGIQEETTVLGIPCLTLRSNTERPVTLTHGTNRLIGTNPEAIVSMALQALNESGRSSDRPPLWDGLASERIVEKLDGRRLRNSADPTAVREAASTVS
ncbi:MAG TPA: UDP-N-acetylglucosamine 2-epimerase (non-hydrolyzing) [Terriglobia bacterium]|nr:UDP-N-acetylglucosamine 2-epimerase (non-hydrolyzing) [Terriglobia bacterium]